MKRSVFYGAALLCLLSSCQKVVDMIADKTTTTAPTTPGISGFIQYTIPQGQHSADKSGYKPVNLTELKFVVKFDSTAVYQSAVAENQWDINKLYGFSDNNSDHHQFSARFGWNWRDGALRLHAYVYNKGVVDSKEIGVVAIGAETVCSIKVMDGAYLFTMGDKTVSMPRMSAGPRAVGYQLYPYFGGDENAPHEVRIYIKDL